MADNLAYYTQRKEVSVTYSEPEVRKALQQCWQMALIKMWTDEPLRDHKTKVTFHLHPPTHTGKRFVQVSVYVKYAGDYDFESFLSDDDEDKEIGWDEK